MRIYEDFQTMVTRKTFHIQSTPHLNMICNVCHCNCVCVTGTGRMFPDMTIFFMLFAGIDYKTQTARTCKVCPHKHQDHGAVRAIWVEKDETVNDVDEEARERFASASTEKERKESMRELVRKTLDTLQEQLECDTKLLGHIAEEYAGLSLSGSFTSQVYKSVKLLETKVESMRNDNTGSEVIARMERSLERLKDKLKVLEEAQRRTRGSTR